MDKIIQASRVDKAGKYVEALALIEKDGNYFNLLDQEVPIDDTVVFDPLPMPIYTPIWDFKRKVWKEGLSPEEIEEIKNRPDPPDPMKVMAEEVKALQEALNYLLLGGEKD
ncbi:hypothetical protein ERICIV_03577 [Paenibacillus larvae subsp. larvae]|uniref:Uncharacterized protein n=2 Tax=Paenibacillus larvae TaxID=1464 RepID=A0A2L1UHS0_9BACL|nr:hypothetical protein [Paenibacillus larvae]AQT84283.1 hypothetical protein B1222_07535 [Paenibacillus larvae subsp. pulvifaciens]AQZ46264.1 hypothetical protein B5S25_06120 [Paenibacillus larvae subsp. pulvifaciens]AVF27939.1 hypothetical protein ERICIII_03835 [Paenibacillus larvae subsp. larvae]AVF32441.1 hypothetical protein ERICIV_03577 [Paenibacillus larvae subsp. larvae]MBH0343664.1 hypothetical protein [Paenibacillus larvae]